MKKKKLTKTELKQTIDEVLNKDIPPSVKLKKIRHIIHNDFKWVSE